MYSSGFNANAAAGSDGDFLDLATPPEQEPPRRPAGGGGGGARREEMIPSYDFQPIHTVRSSPPTAHDAWGAGDSNAAGSSGLKFSGIMESHELTKASHEKERAAYDTATVVEIDRTVKKYADTIMHAMDNVSSRLSKMENRSHHLQDSVDGLKVAIGNTNGSTDGKLRQLENILREVHTGLQVWRDKQEIAEAQMQLKKLLQISKVDNQTTESSNTGLSEPRQPPASPQRSVQQPLQPPVAPPPQPLAPPAPLAPNAPFPPQQNQTPVQFPGQLPHTQIPSLNSYYGPPPPPTDTPNQQYQIPPHQHQPPPPPPQSYQPPPQLPLYSQHGQPPPPVTPLQPQPSLPHHAEDSPYIPPPQSYPPNIRQSPYTQPPNDPRQQFYGPTNSMYEPPTTRPGSGHLPFSGAYPHAAPPNFSDSYHYNEPPPHYSSSPVKPSPFSSATATSGGNNYHRLPTAQVLPQAQPSGSSGSTTGNRVAVDDVVDKVSTMGFSRDQVRAAVKKLTENGQSVDLNVVLDKLMNDGEVIQPQKGWFGR